MSGKLLDSNVLIYLSKKELDFKKVASPDDQIFISVITYMEVLGYTFENNSEKQIIENLCKHLPIIELDSEIVETVITIRQQHKIKLPDAIILASAITRNAELVTANISDFEHIDPRLKIFNPMN